MRPLDIPRLVGDGVLEPLLASLTAPVLVGSESGIERLVTLLDRPHLPTAVVASRSWTDLEPLSRHLERSGYTTVIAYGGGAVLDAAKYLALRTGLDLIAVPSGLSTGAIVNGAICDIVDGVVQGRPSDIAWVTPLLTIFDWTVLEQAPPRVNTAGMGDVLCAYASVVEIEWLMSRGKRPPEAAADADRLDRFLASVAARFVETLDGTELTRESLAVTADALFARLEHSSGSENNFPSDHLFPQAIESQEDTPPILHGESVALGAACVEWIHLGEPGRTIELLDRCGVTWRPRELGLTHTQLARAIVTARELAAGASAFWSAYDSVLHTATGREESIASELMML